MVAGSNHVVIPHYNFTGDVLMTDLERFLKWCESLGHYAAIEAVERYLAMIESLENDNG
jgi:hypothetical protein